MDYLNDIEIFKLALDNTSSHIVMTDIDGKILYANHGSEKITGYSKEEIIGKNPRIWGGLMDKAFYERLWHTIKVEKKPFVAEFRNRRKNGEIYYSVGHISPILDKENNLLGFLSNEEDISILKKLTEDVSGQKTFLRKVIDTDPHLLFAKDWDGRFTLVNRAVADIYGTSVEELLGKTDADFNKKEAEVAHFLADDREVMMTKKPKFIPEEPVTNQKTGETRFFQTIKIPLEVENKPVQILGVSTDITDRKHYEDIVEVEKVKAEAILKSIGEGLIATDKGGFITMMNPTAEVLLGYKFEELKGKKLADTILVLDESGVPIPAKNRASTRALLSGKSVSTSTNYYVRHDGSKFPIYATVTPIVLNNTIIGSIQVFRDITHEKDVEQSKTEFVSLAAHQLRAPLTSVSWHTELLLDKNKIDDEKKESYIKEIYQANKRMIQLVDALLNVSRIELGTFTIAPTNIDLVKISKILIEELGSQFKNKGLSIIDTYSKESILIKGDENLVKMILHNLFTNAIKYSFPRGKIFLDIEDGNKVTIKVVNNGIGIEKTDRKKIFSKFFRGEKAKKLDSLGNGLGLYLVKSIVDRMKGKILFESNGGETLFFVTLPKGQL